MLAHAWIKIKPCLKNGPQIATALESVSTEYRSNTEIADTSIHAFATLLILLEMELTGSVCA